MRILAAFRVTPDLEILRESDWVAGTGAGEGAGEGASTRRPETRFAPRIFDAFDESALETGLRLRDAAAGGGMEGGTEDASETTRSVSLAALSIGGRESDRHLTTLGALGYDPLLRVEADADLDFAPDVVGSIIAATVRRLPGCEVLLLGARSTPGDSGVIPFLTAETLGWPCLAPVVEVRPLSDGRLRVSCAADDGLLEVTVRPPCVLAVGNAVVSRLRVPTLSDRLARRDATIEVVSPADLGVDTTRPAVDGGFRLTGLGVVDRHRAGLRVEGRTVQEQARTLFESHLRARMERL